MAGPRQTGYYYRSIADEIGTVKSLPGATVGNARHRRHFASPVIALHAQGITADNIVT